MAPSAATPYGHPKRDVLPRQPLRAASPTLGNTAAGSCALSSLAAREGDVKLPAMLQRQPLGFLPQVLAVGEQPTVLRELKGTGHRLVQQPHGQQTPRVVTRVYRSYHRAMASSDLMAARHMRVRGWPTGGMMRPCELPAAHFSAAERDRWVAGTSHTEHRHARTHRRRPPKLSAA